MLVGCEPKKTNTLKEGEIISLDQQLLPNREWQISRSVIELLSFCRDRVNEDLLASESELRGWRGSGEPTAFPPYRDEGLEKLAELLLCLTNQCPVNQHYCGKKTVMSVRSVTTLRCRQAHQKGSLRMRYFLWLRSCHRLTKCVMWQLTTHIKSNKQQQTLFADFS